MKTCYYIRLGDGLHAAIADLIEIEHGVYLLTRINVPKQYRKLGHGTDLLKQICEDADQEGAEIRLEPQPSDGMPILPLIFWYAKHGFKSYNLVGVMHRKPKLPVVVAFLQNPYMWASTRSSTKMRYTHDDDYRRRCLFSGCLTGQKLLKYFGEDLVRRIIWENANPKIGTESWHRFDPDIDHIKSVLAKHSPKVVIAFGEPAQKGIRLAGYTGELIECPHPAARGYNFPLRRAAYKVKQCLSPK